MASDPHAYGHYKGETTSKSVARVLVWKQHAHLLPPGTFKASPHVFLASRVAGDVATLSGMGVPSSHIWAVEKEREQYQHLLARRKREGFRLFPQKIETVMTSHTDANIRSVYLDYCGTVFGTASTTRRVVSLLPSCSVLSVTLFLGREHVRPGDREAVLLRQVRDATVHQVTVVQSVLYASSPDGSPFGSPMGTWTFYVGPSTSRSKMRFDLRGANTDVKRLATTSGAVADFWQAHLTRADVRCKAAVKANQTRS
jgi:hypothetical protein